MSNAIPAEDQPLSEALRDATRQVHHEVENLPLVQALLSGTVPREVFVRYTGHLLSIYKALEEGLTHHQAHPACAGLMIPGLARVPHLMADLAFLKGEALDSSVARRIRELDQNFPPGLVAYFYLRYFGDLNGGQMLGQALLQLMSDSGGAGLSFYRFAELGPVGEAKQSLRNRLNAVVLSHSERRAVLNEAVRGFQEHAQLFRSLL
jgi:heme oxygenase